MEADVGIQFDGSEFLMTFLESQISESPEILLCMFGIIEHTAYAYSYGYEEFLVSMIVPLVFTKGLTTPDLVAPTLRMLT